MLNFRPGRRLPLSARLTCLPQLPVLLTLALGLAACSPTLDWREVKASEGPYTVLMPAKPASHTRQLTLGELRADMTMRGAEVEGVSYAVGTAVLADEAQARQAASAMQAGMLKNIGTGPAAGKSVMAAGIPMTEVVANGKSPGGQPVSLRARFGASGTRAYQVVVLGPANRVQDEAAATFLESFTPQHP